MTQSRAYISRLYDLPPNFEALANDVALGLSTVYGEDGATLYRQHASQIFSGYLHSPNMRFWAARLGEECTAAVLTNLCGNRGEISLVHVLQESVDGGTEAQLLNAALSDLFSRGVDHILAEYLPTSAADLSATFLAAGFVRVPRLVLSRPLSGTSFSLPSDVVLESLEEKHSTAAAQCLVDAYAQDPGRLLHREVQTAIQAETFVRRALTGDFGATGPGMNVGLWRDSRCVGVILGCLLAPAVGFTLQVGVLPGERGKGTGRHLLNAQLSAFHQAGCGSATLAVTSSNRVARNLYVTQGYQLVRSFDAFVWYSQWDSGEREELEQSARA